MAVAAISKFSREHWRTVRLGMLQRLDDEELLSVLSAGGFDGTVQDIRKARREVLKRWSDSLSDRTVVDLIGEEIARLEHLERMAIDGAADHPDDPAWLAMIARVSRDRVALLGIEGRHPSLVEEAIGRGMTLVEIDVSDGKRLRLVTASDAQNLKNALARPDEDEEVVDIAFPSKSP